MKNLGYNIFRFLFALLFLTTAIGKLLDNRGFSEVIETYQLGIPSQILLPLALFVSFFELYIAINLIRELRVRWMAIFIIINHTFYLSLAVVTLYRGLSLSNCGCFGVFWARPMTIQTVVEDSTLLVLSVWFYFLCTKKFRKLSFL